jgi:type I restriction enzyme, S subunit
MALLDKASRQLYQEWFVRFRFPGHERTKIIDGFPAGWEKKRIRCMAECVGGGTPSTANSAFWEDGTITWVTPTDVTRNEHFVLLDADKKITAAGLQNSSAKLVPPHAVLMTSRASVGFFAVAGARSAQTRVLFQSWRRMLCFRFFCCSNSANAWKKFGRWAVVARTQK